MTAPDLKALRDYNAELNFLTKKLEEKQNEIDREIDRIKLVQECIESVLNANPELNLGVN
jgi:hypothetical protein